jgi:hypothetical protein
VHSRAAVHFAAVCPVEPVADVRAATDGVDPIAQDGEDASSREERRPPCAHESTVAVPACLAAFRGYPAKTERSARRTSTAHLAANVPILEASRERTWA